MTNSNELKQERSEILEKIAGINALAEDRALKPSEKREYDKYKSQVSQLDLKILDAGANERAAAMRAGKKVGAKTSTTFNESAEKLGAILRGGGKGDVDFNPALIARFGTPESASMGNVTGSYVSDYTETQAQSDLSYIRELNTKPVENNTRWPYVKRTDRASVAKKSYSATLTDTDYVVSAVTTEFNNLYVSLGVHRDVFRDDVAGLEGTLQTLAFQDIEQQLAYDVLFADGTSNSVTGIKSITGVQTIDNGTAALTDWSQIIEAYRKLLEKNVNPSNIACVMHPGVWKQIASFEDTTGQPLQMPKQIENLRFYVNSQINTNEGTGTDESTIFIGDFSKFDLLVDQQYTVVSNDGPNMKKDATDMLFTFRFDLKTMEPDHMLMITGIQIS